MPSRRALLSGGAGLLAAGSLAGVTNFAGISTNAGRSSESGGRAEARDDRTGTRPSVLVAGSLQKVAAEMGEATVEAHGSVACRRLLEDGLRDPDAVALADPTLFAGLADRVTCFATNALVVALDESIAGEYDDWRGLLADSDLTLGRTDPERDPLGYRTVMALRLAEEVDAEDALARTKVFPETGLLRTLEAGGLDAAFAYRNMAVEHDLPFLELPASIDFSDPERADAYARAGVDLGDRTVRGSPIRYAAHARTARGSEWVRALSGAHVRLEEAGFGVPAAYPTSYDVLE